MTVLAAVTMLIPSILVSTGDSAYAGTSSDPRKERQAVRNKKAQVAGKVDALKASSDQVNDALDALEQNVAEAESDYSSARKAAITAAANAEDAISSAEAKTVALAEAQAKLQSLAMRSYVEGAEAESGGIEMLTSDPASGLIRSGYSAVSSANVGDTVDEIRQRSQDLANLQMRAEQAAALADQQKAAEADQLSEVSKRQGEQQELADKLEARLERTLSEASSLAELDANLSQQIAKQDAALAARLAKARRSANSGGASSGGTSSRGNVVGIDSTTMAGGFRVHVDIANNVSRMVSAASADGLNLGGSGWRSSDGQVALRRSNCGSSEYSIWSAPASSCRPPTARPGASMHERGKAIDFTCNGSLINSRSNSCYRWLAENASSYGFYNLPSEPWHWSTNGN